MKIFNWMRRRFNDDNKGRSVENVTQDGDEMNDINNDHMNDDYNKCLLNDHHINDQWSGGYLLSIGTFGFDPFKHNYNPNQQPKECPNQYNVLDKDIVEKEKEIDENQELYDDELRQGKKEVESMNGPVVAAVGPPLIDQRHFRDDQTAALMKINKLDSGDDDDVDEITMIMEKKEMRITLADLFNAESAEMLTEKVGPSPPPLSLLPPPPPLYRMVVNKEAKPLELMSKIEATIHPLEGKEFKKKKKLSSKSIKQISQPIQKLVIKMLKRKIYPDIEARIKANNVSQQQTSGIISEVGA